jgi:hypothetical protein
METVNPYLVELENCSEDELFEIISTPSETDNPSKYTAAISIALKRELISEYQAENLLDGNTTVLDFNPNEINHDVEDFVKEKEIQKEEIKKAKVSDITYGLMLIGFGVLLLIFVYTGDLFFHHRTKFVGIVSISVGTIILLIGLFEKNQRKKNNLQP